MIIDAHHHLWQPERGYTWLAEPGLAAIRRPFTPADLTAELSASGVHGTVLVEGGRCHPDEAAEFLGYAADTAPILGVVAWIDVAADDVSATIARYRRARGGELLVGLRSQVQGEADPDYLDRPEVRRGLAAIAAAGLVFDLVIRADQLAAAARAARAVPQLTFVLDHLGKPRIDEGEAGLRCWRDPFAALAANPNVSAKLSGLVTEAGPEWAAEDLRPFVRVAVEEFGPGRLMFGSDWPVCLLRSDYPGVRRALEEVLPPLTARERHEIFAGTALGAYGLVRPDADAEPAGPST
ncbi:amidohydrolase family protein [Micromonospora endophytica]|uniref:Amidohydrolase n=1 Tax=Micromonospora endophytica TaxID=515350 RepID=A0A2W2D3P2_9ACTN|nr:amidohydrolase family protein [Micromonospora endophytica]PZG00215.1 amidohydrolase [Micromonospora endophytica]RIW41165.1 amidohydrolase [Micromonospora endophytica]BCJ62382.1 amidohydrolase [Micromonospora endophytica]